MALPKLTKLELQIMDALWSHGASSVREIQERFPEKDRPAYTTVQTMVYRLEAKKAIRRVKKIGNAHIFDALISRSAAQRRLIDELLSFFGGRSQPVMAHLIESGKLTLEDVQGSGADAPHSWRERTSHHDRAGRANHLWQSTLVRGAGRTAGAACQTPPRPGAVLAVAGGVAEVPGPVRRADGPRPQLGWRLRWRGRAARR